MIIESPLQVDRERGTSSFIAAANFCMSYGQLNQQDVERVLTWHALQTHVFVKAHTLLRNLARRENADEFCVRMISPKMVAISLRGPNTDVVGGSTMVLVLDESGEVTDCGELLVPLRLNGKSLSSRYYSEFAVGMQLPDNWTDQLLTQWRSTPVQVKRT